MATFVPEPVIAPDSEKDGLHMVNSRTQWQRTRQISPLQRVDIHELRVAGLRRPGSQTIVVPFHVIYRRAVLSHLTSRTNWKF